MQESRHTFTLDSVKCKEERGRESVCMCRGWVCEHANVCVHENVSACVCIYRYEVRVSVCKCLCLCVCVYVRERQTEREREREGQSCRAAC